MLLWIHTSHMLLLFTKQNSKACNHSFLFLARLSIRYVLVFSSKSSSLNFLCKLIGPMFHLFSVIWYIELMAGLTSLHRTAVPACKGFLYFRFQKLRG